MEKFESHNQSEKTPEQDSVPVWESPEAVEQKINETVKIIMSSDNINEVEKMSLASNIANKTFKPKDGETLMQRIGEEIQKSKQKPQNEERAGKKRAGEHEWEKGSDKTT